MNVVDVPVTALAVCPVDVAPPQLERELAVRTTEYGVVPTACHETVSVTDCPLSMTADGAMVMVLPVNAELTGIDDFKHMLAAGEPVLLSPTMTEYELAKVRGPVENVEDVWPEMGVEHEVPVYHW